jgi:hypothetical protein
MVKVTDEWWIWKVVDGRRLCPRWHLKQATLQYESRPHRDDVCGTLEVNGQCQISVPLSTKVQRLTDCGPEIAETVVYEKNPYLCRAWNHSNSATSQSHRNDLSDTIHSAVNRKMKMISVNKTSEEEMD